MREEEAQAIRVDDALRQVDDGLPEMEMVDFPDLEPLRGRRGLRWLEHALAQLDEHRRRLAQRESERWPKRFTYVGPPAAADRVGSTVDPRFRTVVDGRALQIGDAVMLSEAQAAAWADRFAPLDETVAEPQLV